MTVNMNSKCFVPRLPPAFLGSLGTGLLLGSCVVQLGSTNTSRHIFTSTGGGGGGGGAGSIWIRLGGYASVKLCVCGGGGGGGGC